MVQHVMFGDCRKVLGRIKSGTFQMVVTSAPQHLGAGYSDLYDELPFGEYLEVTREWLKQAYRILMNGGRLCVSVPVMCFGDSRNLLYAYSRLIRKVGFCERDMIVWVKKVCSASKAYIVRHS